MDATEGEFDVLASDAQLSFSLPAMQIIADALKAQDKASDAQSQDGSEDEEVEDAEDDEESDAEVDVDEFAEDSETSSLASEDEDEDEAEEAQAPLAGAQQAKRQKTGAAQPQGLGSVGWDASDDEDDQQIAAAAHPGLYSAMHSPLSNPILCVAVASCCECLTAPNCVSYMFFCLLSHSTLCQTLDPGRLWHHSRTSLQGTSPLQQVLHRKLGATCYSQCCAATHHC